MQPLGPLGRHNFQRRSGSGVIILSFLQVEMMQNEVRDKEDENSALQREMSAARQKHEEATQALVGSQPLFVYCFLFIIFFIPRRASVP